MTRVALLLSGGLDSSALAAWLLQQGHEVHALTIDYGQTHAEELTHAALVASRLDLPLHRLDLHSLATVMPSDLTGSTGGKVVPNRNAVLLSVATAFAMTHACGAIAVGVNADDAKDFYDCRPGFMQRMRAVTEAVGVELWAPFLTRTKAEVVEAGMRCGAPLALTRSCYRTGSPCGECDACADREAATRHAVPR